MACIQYCFIVIYRLFDTKLEMLRDVCVFTSRNEFYITFQTISNNCFYKTYSFRFHIFDTTIYVDCIILTCMYIIFFFVFWVCCFLSVVYLSVYRCVFSFQTDILLIIKLLTYQTFFQPVWYITKMYYSVRFTLYMIQFLRYFFLNCDSNSLYDLFWCFKGTSTFCSKVDLCNDISNQ